MIDDPDCDRPNGGRYTRPAIWLHWLMVPVAVGLLPVAWVMMSLPDTASWKFPLFALHKSLGLTVWLLVVARLVWRFRHPAPPLGHGTPRLLAWAAIASHWLLYLVFFAMPISGYTLSSAGGHGVAFWGIPLPSLPKNEALAKLATTAHLTGQWAVYALLLLHVGAATWHVLVRRDGTLQRMVPPQTEGR